jgi:uridine phosphorylase
MQYHLRVKPGEVAQYVLLPGDPARAELIAKRFDDAREIAYNREFRTFTGEVAGIPISVTSTGIGCPSTAIAVEELAECGANTFIRVGTAGAISTKLKVGEVVIASAAVREEGTSRQYVPISYPAVADLEVTNALIEAAELAKAKYRVGLVLSKDAFYSEEPERVPLGEQAAERWKLWRRANVLATEMECSTIYTLCGIRGLRAGAVLAIIGPIGKIADPHAGIGEAIDIAIEAVKLLAKGRRAAPFEKSRPSASIHLHG